MPRPPLLPTIDWKSTFENGTRWDKWLEEADSADQAARMAERFSSLVVLEDLKPRFGAMARPVYVVAIAEDWCGDVVRHAPVMARITAEHPLVQLRFISRASNLDLFARFLTNGGEAIPKFIFLSEAWVECANWGPMQADCRKLIARGKAAGDVSRAREIVSQIYQDDPNCATAFTELWELVELAGAQAVE